MLDEHLPVHGYTCSVIFTFSGLWDYWIKTFELPHDKTNKMTCAVPSKDSDPPSLIRVFAVHMKKAWVLSYPLSTQQRLWSHWVDAQVGLCLCWAHRSFCWLCHEVAHFIWKQSNSKPVARIHDGCCIFHEKTQVCFFKFCMSEGSQEQIHKGLQSSIGVVPTLLLVIFMGDFGENLEILCIFAQSSPKQPHPLSEILHLALDPLPRGPTFFRLSIRMLWKLEWFWRQNTCNIWTT